jgi:hypothetical protein
MSRAQPWETRDGTLHLRVRLTPKAGADRLGGLYTDADDRAWLAARVTAAPEKGRANAALVKLLSRTLGCGKSAISVVSGATDRSKWLAIEGDPHELAARLASLIGERQP